MNCSENKFKLRTILHGLTKRIWGICTLLTFVEKTTKIIIKVLLMKSRHNSSDSVAKIITPFQNIRASSTMKTSKGSFQN